MGQNKMDCSLTKTVNRRPEIRAEHNEPWANIAAYIHLFRAHTGHPSIHLEILLAYYKIHKTATNIRHSHYSLTRTRNRTLILRPPFWGVAGVASEFAEWIEWDSMR